MYFCVVNGTKKNALFSVEEYREKTVNDIIHDAGILDSVLGYRNPFYTEAVDGNSKPLEMYPDLVLETKPLDYPPPRFYLKAIPVPDSKTIWIEVKLRTQLKVNFPTMPVPVCKTDIPCLSCYDLLLKCKAVFGYDVTSEKLLIGEEVIDEHSPAAPVLERCRTEHLVFSCEVGESGRRKILTRGHLSVEIVNTEESYNKDLEMLEEYWEPAFRNSRIFEEKEVHSLFRDIKSIRKVHVAFLNYLRSLQTSYETEMAGAFLNFLDQFSIATAFVSAYKSMDDMLKRKRAAKSFDSKMKEIENSVPGNTGRDFTSYYITPVQRYPRYPLLFRDLDKNTPSFHPDKQYLALCTQNLTAVNKKIDAISHRVRQLQLMNEIQSRMPDNVLILEHAREIIEQTDVRIVSKKSGPGVLYLFNDQVMLAFVKKKQHIPELMKDIISFRFSNCRPTMNSITIEEGEDVFQIDFSDYQEKSTWMDLYSAQINEKFNSINKEKAFVKWRDVEIAEGVFDIMGHDGCVSNGSAFFFGGVNESNSVVSTLIRYNIGESTWSVEKTQVPARQLHTISAVRGDLFVSFGKGKDKDKIFNNIWTYNQTTKEWSLVQPAGTPPLPRFSHTCVPHNGKLYYFGGTINGKPSNQLDIYDPSTNEFKTVPTENTPCPRSSHSATIFGKNKMVIVGGRSENGPLGDVWVLNMETLKWSNRSYAVVDPRLDHKVAVVGGRWIFVIGGIVDQNRHQNVQIIDGKSWTNAKVEEFGNIPPSLSYQSVLAIDTNRLLTFGGLSRLYRKNYSSAWIMDSTDTLHSLLASRPIQGIDKYWVVSQDSSQPSIKHVSQRSNTTKSRPQQNDLTPEQLEIQRATAELALKSLENRRASINIDSQTRKMVEESLNTPPPPPVTKSASDNMIQVNSGPSPRNNDKKENKEPIIASPKVEINLKEVTLRPVQKPTPSPTSEPVPPPIESITLKKVPEKPKPGKGNEFKTPQEGISSDLIKQMKGNLKANTQIYEKKPETINPLTQPPAQVAPTKEQALKMGSKFNQFQFFEQIGISTSELNPLQQRATCIKAQNLWKAIQKNDEEEAKVKRMEAFASGNFDPPENTPMLLKVFDETNNASKIRKVNTSQSFSTIIETVFELIGGKEAILSVSVGRGQMKSFDEESLKEAFRCVFKGEMRCVTVSSM